ncbi:MAG: hypothetical protein US86_C0001G0010 [Candidatus Daviesbacteria bacterium GW2011_GWA2_38_24]|uniref:GIY-YIG domain-containing protein n=1 Tax=Candidatus Daviesbacteria bacterium GW2011_GWA2_38_24 TaxID=1618422 RepID=A0A0G0JHE9_9BACT|nr:MAG: hypothetical protein US86_C0001G0010 [Candidatus Daviesbacteria bacterium GW2011_GWA2_38_24]KKQ80940.1 MAG: hypothetical protein UT01_C0003G0007 [Candidatus Daviesbacteria bacterium GW2011_GWA1_38_7]
MTGGSASPVTLDSGQRYNKLMKFYYTYVLKSIKDQKLYIGSTGDIKERFKAHNQGEVKSTKNRRPFNLIYFEACQDKKQAEKREKYFKTGYGRKFLRDRI